MRGVDLVFCVTVTPVNTTLLCHLKLCHDSKGENLASLLFRVPQEPGGVEQGTSNADMNIRNGVMAEYKHESRRASHDAPHENVAFCNGHTRKDRSPEVVKPQQQVYSNSLSCHAPEGGSRRASVVCYRDGEECVFRKGICYSENCAALTDENLNESSAARLKPEDDCSARKKRSLVASSEESLLSIFKQAAVPFFLGGLGTVFAGLILDTVQFWPPFEHVTELFIVVPPLLGLKGNLGDDASGKAVDASQPG
ncbi:hypothetical protein MRX96_000341 [Rhipicephalus microplus]